MAVDAARANGWCAETEVIGTTPSGETWRADVLAHKGGQKVAIEIQWSGQTADEILRRQERYRASGVRALWLIRQPGFPISHDLPAACIGGSLEEGFSALIPRKSCMSVSDRKRLRGWHQVVPMRGFLDAAFGKRLRFGVPLDIEATVSVRGGYATCWHETCRARTRIVTGVFVIFAPCVCRFTIPQLGEHPALLRSVLNRLPEGIGAGEVRWRYSRSRGRCYASNGCVQCDRLFGEAFEFVARTDEEELCRLPIRMSEPWRHAIRTSDAYQETWSVYRTVTPMATRVPLQPLQMVTP